MALTRHQISLLALPKMQARIRKEGECLLWQGAFTHGVPCISVKRKRVRVRNALMPAFRLNVNVVICVCENEDICVNPEHLRVVSLAEAYKIKGWARSDDPENGPGSYQRKKTHCPRGHAYTEKNTYHAPGRPTERRCKACIRMRGKHEG